MRALQLALADFKERRRRYSFFITIAIALYMVFLLVPPAGAEFYFTVILGKYRGIYNSPWVGTVVAVSMSTFLTLIGFYLVKNTIARDRQTGVGELLAATTMPTSGYILSKFLSNLFYLVSIAAPLMLMAGVLQLLRAEDTDLKLWPLLSPFLYLTLPNLMFVSGAAAMYEAMPGLRRGFGNVIYFYMYMPLMIIPIELGTELDLMGIAILEKDMQAAFHAVFPDAKAGFSLGKIDAAMPAGSFSWEGSDWTTTRIWGRLLWVGVALFFTAVAIPFFDRFDPARQSKRARKAKSLGGVKIARLSRTLTTKLLAVFSLVLERFRFGRIVLAELRLALLGLSPIWYVITAALWIATIVTPLEPAGRYLISALWIMPILIWSQAGVRERLQRVDQVLFATPNPVLRHALGVWLSGVILAALCASGYGLRLALAGNSETFFALVAGALFVPSLALACGTLTQTSRTFEIAYLMLWYIGPLNNVHALDYIGVYPETVASGILYVYFALSAALLTLALTTRLRQARG